MGDQTNAPERWTLRGIGGRQVLATGGPDIRLHERRDVVDAAAYEQAIRERDEAMRAAGELAARLWRLPAEQRELVLGDAEPAPSVEGDGEAWSREFRVAEHAARMHLAHGDVNRARQEPDRVGLPPAAGVQSTTETATGPRSVACPICPAAAGNQCVDLESMRLLDREHRDRLVAALAAPATPEGTDA